MAEAVLGVVTETVLSKVISLANERISGVLGVKEDLQSLTKELEFIQAMLFDAESKSITNKTIEVWLKELKDAATVADDLLDEFAYEVLSKKILRGKKEKVSSFFSSSNPLVFGCKMVLRIKQIKLQINEIFKRANEIGLMPAKIINSPSDPRKVTLTDPFVDDSEIIGRDNDVSKILCQLACSMDEKKLSVIGIVGMGGQGKTSLAQLLTKNDEVKRDFEKRIWTCVSDDFNVDGILKDMLQFLTGEASQLTNRKAIVERLSKELQGKRYLLVLDDVWKIHSQLWERLSNCLQEIGGSKGSKMIVTTRDLRVVNVMNGFVHRLGELSTEDSQELFERMAFGNGRVAKTPQLVEIGKRIVARCGGLPLALKTIGALTSSQRDELEWLKIEESRIWSTLSGVHSAIKLSFDHLPSLSLKQCFAYCSIFPKDSIIEKKDLIQQWMAHGMLNPSRESVLGMEDIGNNYFKILLHRSLLQEPEFDTGNNIISCKMHDLVHDFVSEISKDHCLIAEIGELADDFKAVHLSIEIPNGSENLNISEKNFSRLRTLHLHGDSSSENFLLHCKSKHLRVLIVIDPRMKRLPISVAKLKHLRYLDISRTQIDALPEFISQLYNLQTLRLPFLETLPKNFSRCVNLRHLHVLEDIFGTHRHHLVPGIGQLTSLQTLNCFPVSTEKRSQIKELYSLKHLEGRVRIAGLENVANGEDARRANLSGKRNIESLELVWIDRLTGGQSRGDEGVVEVDESVLEGLEPHSCLKALKIINFMGIRLPSWALQLRNLMRMELQDLRNCEEIPPLGHLPFLNILRIDGMFKVKSVSNDFYGWPDLVSSNSVVAVFPSLKKLSFRFMKSLEKWPDMVPPSSISSSSVKLFPNLEKLFIHSCDCLTLLPKALSAMTSLESLTITFCDNLVSAPDLSSLCSLKELRMSNCKQLSALPRGIEACNSLRSLEIIGPASLVDTLPPYLTNLRNLTLQLSEDITYPYIPREPICNCTGNDIQPAGHDPFSTLEYLHLNGMMSQLNSLPEQIQHFTALRFLVLEHFDGLDSLPEWLGKLHSLELLGLSNCYSLQNFPSVEVMQGLTNLDYLFMTVCPILRQRCEKENGAEWHKIAHIPQLSLHD